MKKKHEEAAGIMGKGRMKKCSPTGIMWKGKMKKCSVGTLGTKVVTRHCPKVELPIDVQLRILACLQVEDFFESCLLVCKQWKDAILSSDARLQQHKKSFWGIVNSQKPDYSNKSLVFKDGPYKVLNLALSFYESVTCSDKGIVCILDKQRKVWDPQLKVGNPLIKDKWKVAPIHSPRFLPMAMSVDTSTSPASFKIVGFEFETTAPSILRTRIFDSKTNTWSKEKVISMHASSQGKLGQTLVVVFRGSKKIVTYDFEQDRWTVKGYRSPENNKLIEEEIILCKEEPILVSYPWPWVMLWKENSCCKGIIKWTLMTKLNIKAFLAEPELEIEWGGFSHCLGDVITVMAELSSKKTALLNYDMRQGCWKLGGSMEGACGGVIDMHFTPSLVRV